jgi:hypothetical protein
MSAVATRVDVGDLSSVIANEAHDRLGGMVATFVQREIDHGSALTEVQHGRLVEEMLSAFDGYLRMVAETLVEELGRCGVPVWGLPDELADLYGERGPDDA